MTPTQRLTYNLASRGIIATRSGSKWTLYQTDTRTATAALFDPHTIQTATYKALTNTRNGYTFTTKEARQMAEG
jgi:hypothetical protein